jgi:hypothetical protein
MFRRKNTAITAEADALTLSNATLAAFATLAEADAATVADFANANGNKVFLAYAATNAATNAATLNNANDANANVNDNDANFAACLAACLADFSVQNASLDALLTVDTLAHADAAFTDMTDANAITLAALANDNDKDAKFAALVDLAATNAGLAALTRLTDALLRDQSGKKVKP